LILGEISAEGGLADVQDVPDKPMGGSFVVNAERKQFAPAVGFKAGVFKGFDDVIRLLRGQVKVSHSE
jgi:hypothetical protein